MRSFQKNKTKPKITVYHKPACRTCREAITALNEAGADFLLVNYYARPLTKGQIVRLLKKMRIPAKELLRTKAPLYQELGLADEGLSERKAIEAMAKCPDFIQRPIVEWGERAVVARPAALIKGFLTGMGS